MKIRLLSISFLSICVAPLVSAQQTPQSLADAELPSLLTIYKDIHIHPELSTQEQRTSAIVAKELRAAGCEVTEDFGKYDNPKLKSYGVIGIMRNGDGPKVLVRTDMDALPVEEETGLPYASKAVAKNDEGKEVHVMHACGHDYRCCPCAGKIERSMARHNHLCGSTGGGTGQRRARVTQGRSLRKIRQT
jgi:hippurate hydrolase